VNSRDEVRRVRVIITAVSGRASFNRARRPHSRPHEIEMSLPADIFRAPPHKLKDKIHAIGHVDVSGLCGYLGGKTREEWMENALRQQQFAVHKDTESLVLKWCANSSVDSPVETTRHYADCEALLQPVMALIQKEYQYEKPIVRKAMFAKLKAGGEIVPHMDGAIALRMVHRIHIPIVSNEKVHFFIDDVDHHFKVGEVVEIDNTRFHAVRNLGGQDRVHLIIDYYHQ